MATEAIIDCLNGMNRESVDGVYMATTTPAYREKQSASIIAKVADLRRDIVTADFANSLRGGTSALIAALDAVNAGRAKQFLVAAADCRVPAPDSDFEKLFGDSAAALLLGDSDIAVEIEGSFTISSDFMDIWKREEDNHVQTWEDRFVVTHGYLEHLVEVVLEYFEHEVGFADASEAGECDDVGEGEVFGYLCVDVSLCIFKGEGCFPPGVCFYQDIFNLCHVYLTYYRL